MSEKSLKFLVAVDKKAIVFKQSKKRETKKVLLAHILFRLPKIVMLLNTINDDIRNILSFQIFRVKRNVLVFL